MALVLDVEGAHPTTMQCLEALQWLQEREAFSRVLDMGCGNGILGVTAAHLWDAQVLLADIAEKAVSDANENIIKHQMNNRVQAVRSDGFSHPLVVSSGPYDLIICNMLAQWLQNLAPDVHRSLRPGGYAILSGALIWLWPEVENTYRGLGFEILHQFGAAPWPCFIARRG